MEVQGQMLSVGYVSSQGTRPGGDLGGVPPEEEEEEEEDYGKTVSMEVSTQATTPASFKAERSRSRERPPSAGVRVPSLGKKISRSSSGSRVGHSVSVSDLASRIASLVFRKLEHDTASAGESVRSSSIAAYIRSCLTLVSSPDVCAVVMLIYLDRVFHLRDRFARLPKMALTASNWQLQLLTALRLADKMMNDIYRGNDFFAAAGWVSLQDLNKSEMQMTSALNFRLFVRPEEYSRYMGWIACPKGDILPS